MYCPKCGTSNSDTVNFCRACGTNLTTVSQALTGNPSQPQPKAELTPAEQSRLGHGIKEFFTGLAFLLIAKYLWFTNQHWGVWMLIPAFAILGKAAAELIPLALKYPHLIPWHHSNRSTALPAAAHPPVKATGELPPLPNFEQLPPPSVTESTTRHLDATVHRPREKQL